MSVTRCAFRVVETLHDLLTQATRYVWWVVGGGSGGSGFVGGGSGGSGFVGAFVVVVGNDLTEPVVPCIFSFSSFLPTGSGNVGQEHAMMLWQTARDVIELFRVVVPTAHKVSHTPALQALNNERPNPNTI